MASVSSLFSISSRSAFRFSVKNGLPNCWKKNAVCCHIQDSSAPSLDIDVKKGPDRRDFVVNTLFTSFAVPMLVSDALADTVVEDNVQFYSDDVNKFRISIPKDWQVGSGEPSGFKSVTAFYPDATSTSNVSVVITGLGADFTRLESFGKVDEFAETLVNGLDRSWQRPAGVAAKLIDCKSSKGFYYIEYTLKAPGKSCIHIYSAIGMASNGWYNRLYTVTGQFLEEESEKYGSQIENVVSSFRFS